MLIPTTHPSVQVIRPVCRDSSRLELCLYCVCAHLLLSMHCYNIIAITHALQTVILSQVLYTATTLTEYHMWGSLTLVLVIGASVSLPHLLNSTCPLSIYVPVPGRPALCTNVKYIHQDQVYGVNIPYIFSKYGTHGWLTDTLLYSLRGNGDLEKLRETGRVLCQCVRTTFQAGDSWEERTSPTHGHPAAEPGIRDRQVRVQKASYIVETVKWSMTFLACNQAHTRGVWIRANAVPYDSSMCI